MPWAPSLLTCKVLLTERTTRSGPLLESYAKRVGAGVSLRVFREVGWDWGPRKRPVTQNDMNGTNHRSGTATGCATVWSTRKATLRRVDVSNQLMRHLPGMRLATSLRAPLSEFYHSF